MNPQERRQAEERGRPEQRAAFLEGAVRYVLAHGVARLSLRPLAEALGTSDRMLLYYFGSRDRLLLAVLQEIGRQLQAGLAQGLPPGRLTPGAFVRATWNITRSPEARPLLRLYIEVSGLAAQGEEPFRSVAGAVTEGWLDWIAERLEGTPAMGRGAASGTLATLDGLLLLSFLVPRAHADDAAEWLARRLDP